MWPRSTKSRAAAARSSRSSRAPRGRAPRRRSATRPPGRCEHRRQRRRCRPRPRATRPWRTRAAPEGGARREPPRGLGCRDGCGPLSARRRACAQVQPCDRRRLTGRHAPAQSGARDGSPAGADVKRRRDLDGRVVVDPERVVGGRPVAGGVHPRDTQRVRPVGPPVRVHGGTEVAVAARHRPRVVASQRLVEHEGPPSSCTAPDRTPTLSRAEKAMEATPRNHPAPVQSGPEPPITGGESSPTCTTTRRRPMKPRQPSCGHDVAPQATSAWTRLEENRGAARTQLPNVPRQPGPHHSQRPRRSRRRGRPASRRSSSSARRSPRRRSLPPPGR